MQETRPDVSIIVPVYNGGVGLQMCLQAIRDSSFTDFELIVVDNGSTDHSVQTSQAYTKKVLHCPGPSGPGAARNVGVKEALGEILVFIDADVVIKKETIRGLIEAFRRHPNVAAVFGSYDDEPYAQNFLSQYKNLLHHFVHQEGNPDATTFWGGCGAIRKEIFEKVGGFDQVKYPKPSIEDIELGYRLKQAGYYILLDKTVLSTHLKEWRLGSLLRAEIFYRAIPWSDLIMERKGLINDLNLQIGQRVSAGMTGVACFLLVGGFIHYHLVIAALVPLGIVLFLNRKLFGFFLKKKGLAFTCMAFVMHGIYYLYSSAAFVFSWGKHRIGLKA